MEHMCAWLDECRAWTPARKKSAGRAFLEISRQWALHDPVMAAHVFNQKRRAGLIAFEGPASPVHYAWICRIFGFSVAEKLAALWRRL
jgi:hypothetical protein